MDNEKIYETTFVQSLFDEMSGTYGIVNLVSSFGFARRWRRQCARQIEIPRGAAIADLMSGMGEFCPELAPRLGPEGRILAIDLSPVMCAKARRYEDGRLPTPVNVMQADILDSRLPSESFDIVLSSFGLKTFSEPQLHQLALVVERILRPGGTFSLVEISVPHSRWLRWPYLFYLSKLIPIIGWMFMGNPDNYRMLGVYTEAFGDCTRAAEIFTQAGLMTENRSFFLGCATGLVGRKSPTADHC